MTKLSMLKACASAGDWIGAIRIAARFSQLGEHKEAITRAWAAINNSDFYRAIGQEPEELFAAGVQALKDRYKL